MSNNENEINKKESENNKVQFDVLQNVSDSSQNSGSSSNSSTFFSGPNLDLVYEIPVRVSMEVGHANISIKELLKVQKGSVIELDRYAGEPLDVFVNGKLIAHGEVVVVNEQFGIRITDVVNNKERLEKLGAA